MGDRCYMQVTCRREDLPRFEPLGFRLEFEQTTNCPIVELVDEEANSAHNGDLPTDVPFLASHGPGGNYGSGLIACDGKCFAEVEAGHEGGFVLWWTKASNRPTAESVKSVQRYLAVHRQVQRLFHQLSQTHNA